MADDNLAVLTKSHSAIAAKRRAKYAQIKEVVFDEESRRSFLTGFHKRKVARREQAKKKTQLREKQDRLETRREHRRALAERAARNAAEVEKAYGAVDDECPEVGSAPEAVEEEFEGEEQLATVTVVQDFDIPTLLEGPPRTASETVWVREEVKQTRPKAKAGKVKVKYETKVARAVERRKQRARRTEKAERAGRRRR